MKHKKHFFTIFFGLVLSILIFTSSNAENFPNNIDCNIQACIDYFGANYTGVNGSLTIHDGSLDLTPLSNFTSVGGDLIIRSNVLTNLNGLGNITSVGGDLVIDGNVLTNLSGLGNLSSIGGDLKILMNASLTSLDGLTSLTSISGKIQIVENALLANLNGLGSITSVVAYIDIANNAVLDDLTGLGNITSVSGNLSIFNNAALTNLNGLGNITSVGGQLFIGGNTALTNIDGLISLSTISDKLHIELNTALTNIDGLASLSSIGVDLQITNNAALTNLDGLASLLSVVNGNLTIVNNPALLSFCGLYPLYNTGGTFYTTISGNGANPSQADILAGGPCAPSVTVVAVDIQPESCPNSLGVKNKGAISVAILGTNDLDVQNIDPATLLFEGISPLRWSTEDVATPISDGEECECTIEGSDGFDDLSLKFDSQELVAALGEVNDGDEIVLTLTGNMLDETPIEGSDCVIIRAKGLHKDLAGNLNNVPEEYALFENYPNPFNPNTTIKFAVPEESFIKLEVYNTLGERVNTLVAETLTAGIYSVDWNATDLSSGIYIYRLQAGSFVETKKMIFMK